MRQHFVAHHYNYGFVHIKFSTKFTVINDTEFAISVRFEICIKICVSSIFSLSFSFLDFMIILLFHFMRSLLSRLLACLTNHGSACKWALNENAKFVIPNVKSIHGFLFLAKRIYCIWNAITSGTGTVGFPNSHKLCQINHQRGIDFNWYEIISNRRLWFTTFFKLKFKFELRKTDLHALTPFSTQWPWLDLAMSC